jgi:hypothetical protein
MSEVCIQISDIGSIKMIEALMVEHKEPRSYPYLGIDKLFKSYVVLFHAENQGMVILNRDSTKKHTYLVGDYKNYWDETRFDPYDGIVFLQNK